MVFVLAFELVFDVWCYYYILLLYILYYIIYIYILYYILYIIILLYIHYYTIIYYYIIYYTLLFFFLSFFHPFLLFSPSPIIYLSPLPFLLIPRILVGTYIYLFIFIPSQSNNLTPHKLSEVNVEWCSFNVCGVHFELVDVSCW